MEVQRESNPNGNPLSYPQTPRDSHYQPPKMVAPERKVSRRRQAQEQRGITLQLFKELITKMNEGYHRSINNQNGREISSKVKARPKISKPRQPKQLPARQTKQMKQLKQSMEQNKIRQLKKQELLRNYAIIMTYKIAPVEEIEEPQIVEEEKVVEQVKEDMPA